MAPAGSLRAGEIEMPPQGARTIRIFLWTAIVALSVFPWVGDEFYVDFVVRLMILGIFAMSLDLLVGYTGLVSFGHAAFFGLSGYMLAIFTPEDSPVSLFWVLPACLAATGFAALVIGWIAVRTSGVYFIMITLALAQMLYYFFNDSAYFGGSDGIFVAFRPVVGIGGYVLLDLENPHVFYYFVLGALVASYLLLRTVLNAPFGHVLRAIKTDERRTRSLGFHTQRYKLACFVIAGVVAGLAGFLEASHGGIISPAHLGWHESGLILMTVILGGMGTLYGSVIGAFALGFLQDFLQDTTQHWMLFLGIFIVTVVLLLPNGIAGIIRRITTGSPPVGDDLSERKSK